MKRILILGGTGVFAFFFFLISQAPAALVVHLMPEIDRLQLYAPSGTIWDGRVEQIQAGPLLAGPLDWTLKPSRLLLARADADVELKIESGYVNGRVIAGMNGGLHVPRADGQKLDLATFAPLFGQPRNIVDGIGAFQARDVRVAGMVPQSGEIDLRVFDLEMRLMGRHELGTFSGEARGENGQFDLTFTDVGEEGPFDLDGTVDYNAPERRYELEGTIRAREQAPRNLASALQYMGEPDENGRYAFRFQGRFF